MKIEEYIYLDHAAGTPLSPAVIDSMEPYYKKIFANPSGLCTISRHAQKAMEDARSRIGTLMGVTENEIICTSGGTESCNLAILGAAHARKDKGNHIITSAIEHPAVLNTCAYLEAEGFNVTYIQPDENGYINPSDVADAITENTILVSIMYANNEVGTIQSVNDITALVKEKNSDIYIHTDACQAPAYLPVHSSYLQADLITLNGSKIYGPKGSGILIKKRNIKLQSIMFGGVQEDGFRPGTENVPAIIGFATALEDAVDLQSNDLERAKDLQQHFYSAISKAIPEAHINAKKAETIPSHIHISIPGYESEAVLYELDKRKVCASSGSACSSRSLDPSHVLKAMKMDEAMAHGSLRFTTGKSTTKDTVDHAVKQLRASLDALGNSN